jgi:hypothetical protein
VGEVGPHHRRAGRHPRLQHADVGQVVAAEDADPHRAALAQVAGQRAGVDAGDADDALSLELLVERPAAAPAARDAAGIADDVAAHPDAGRLRVLVVRAGVADVRRRHDDDLAGSSGR